MKDLCSQAMSSVLATFLTLHYLLPPGWLSSWQLEPWDTNFLTSFFSLNKPPIPHPCPRAVNATIIISHLDLKHQSLFVASLHCSQPPVSWEGLLSLPSNCC